MSSEPSFTFNELYPQALTAYDDDEFDEFDDYDEDYEFATSCAHLTIGGDDGFHYNLNIAKSCAVPILDEPTKQEIIKRGKEFSESLSLFSKELPDGKKLQGLFASIDDESLYDYQHSKENDHDFSSPELMEAILQDQIKEISSKIRSGDLKQSFNKNEPAKFFDHVVCQQLNEEIKNKKNLNVNQALKACENNLELFNKLFLDGIKNFFSKVKRFKKDLRFTNICKNAPKPILEILNFDEFHQAIKLKYLQIMRFVYVPSGGGKTTQFKDNPLYYDVDQLVSENQQSFNEFKSFCVKNKCEDYLNIWFKFQLAANSEKLLNKVVLMNHPNQVPNCFKARFNELIILPKMFNWRVRYFSENFYSLLACKNYRKIFLDYKEYKEFVHDYFKISSTYTLEVKRNIHDGYFATTSRVKKRKIQDIENDLDNSYGFYLDRPAKNDENGNPLASLLDD